MVGVSVKNLREAEAAMKELKHQAAKLRTLAAAQPSENSIELATAADKLEAAADQLLKTIQEYRMNIQ